MVQSPSRGGSLPAMANSCTEVSVVSATVGRRSCQIRIQAHDETVLLSTPTQVLCFQIQSLCHAFLAIAAADRLFQPRRRPYTNTAEREHTGGSLCKLLAQADASASNTTVWPRFHYNKGAAVSLRIPTQVLFSKPSYKILHAIHLTRVVPAPGVERSLRPPSVLDGTLDSEM